MYQTFAQLLAFTDHEFGTLTAFKIRNQNIIKEISYHTFVSDVYSLHGWMSENGYSGRHIGLIGKNSYEWMVWYFAIIISGAVAVPINRAFSQDIIYDIVRRFDIEVLLYDSEEIDWMEEAGRKLDVTVKDLKCLHKSAIKQPADNTDPEAVAAIILTSGTTGISKGVMLSQRNLITAYQERDKECYRTILLVLPFHHIAGVECILDILIRGNSGAFCDSVMHLLNDIMFYKPDEICVVPGMVEFLAKYMKETQGKTIGGLSRLISCGAPLQVKYQEILQRYGIELWQIYGMTETSGIITLCDEDLSPGKVGKVQEWDEIEIENGEIKVKGNNVMLGYYRDSKATAQILREGWLYTGDLGFMDNNGLLHITGRKKNLIILSNGENVSPEELEFILSGCPDILEVQVKEEEDRLCAVIYPCQSENFAAEDLHKKIGNYIKNINLELPAFKQIRKITFRNQEFEKNAVGKMKRLCLP